MGFSFTMHILRHLHYASVTMHAATTGRQCEGKSIPNQTEHLRNCIYMQLDILSRGVTRERELSLFSYAYLVNSVLVYPLRTGGPRFIYKTYTYSR